MDFRCTNDKSARASSSAMLHFLGWHLLTLLQKRVALKCNPKSVALKCNTSCRSAGRRNQLQYFCNYDYSPMWSGNHILLGNIFGRINQPKRCAYFMTTNTSTPTSVTTESLTNFKTSFGTKSSETIPTQNSKLAQKKR